MYNRAPTVRRGIRANRTLYLITVIAVAGMLIIASRFGVLAPLEDAAAVPLNAVSSVLNRVGLIINDNVGRFSDMQTLQRRVADLETALALYQAELVDLRELESDYRRLAALLDYTTATRAQEFVTAEVIAVDQSSLLRTVTINRGSRSGVQIGMPVVTEQGLVGRVIQVTANAARIMLINETTSAVSARLQTTRVQGTVVGQPSGALLMDLIPLDAQVRDGDLVITSGLGGNFPADLVIGQVTSVRLAPTGLNQVAQVRSLIDFSTLEFVLVITNFQPVDLSVFQEANAR